MEAQQVQAALVEVERALCLMLGGGGGHGHGREESEAAHRFLQAFQRQYPLAWTCAVAGLTAALERLAADPGAHTTPAASPLPLFLAQTMVHLARKAWAAGGLGVDQLEQAAGLMVRCCQLLQMKMKTQGQQGLQQLASQLGLAVCAGVMTCPRVAPPAVSGDTIALVEQRVAVGGAAVAEARLRLLQLLPEEALRSRSLSVPVERRRAVLRALAAGDGSAAPPPAAQALHHLAVLQPPSPAALAAMRAWLELDGMPWDAVLAPWLPRVLELAHAAVGRWATAADVDGDAGEEEAQLLAAASLELLAGVISPSEAGEDGGPAFGPRKGAAAQEESVRWQRHRRRQSIEAGTAILPFLPHLWSSITRIDSMLHRRVDSSVGRAALRLAVGVGMAGLQPPLPPVREEDRGGEAESALVPPLYRDPSAVLAPLLAATTAGPLPAVLLTLELWQALGDAEQPSFAAAEACAAIDAAALQFVVAAVRRSTFPAGFPEALSLADRQAFVDFREEVREALRGVVGRQGGAGRGRAIATALVEELWSVEGAREAFPLESVVHALSALGKDLPALLSDDALTRLATALPALPLHPAIVRSGALLLSTLSDWLTEEGREEALRAALQSLLASLAFSESKREPFPLKSKQDHAGVIALLKLSHASGAARIAAVPGAADRLVAAYHLTARQPRGPPSPSPPLEPRSQHLLLEVAARVSVHCPGSAVQQLEALCAPMWAAVAAATAAEPPKRDGVVEDEEEGSVFTELRALATVVHAAGGGATTAAGVGALAMCFLARGDGVRSLLAYDSHGHAGWTRGAIALTASLLRALGRAGVDRGGPALLEAYHQCLQGWAPTVLQQVAAASTSPGAFALLPPFLEWAEAALLAPVSQGGGTPSAELTAAAWGMYATVARRCGEALLTLKRGDGGEAREDLAALFFASLGRLPLSPSSPIGPLLAHDSSLLSLALRAATACLDVQGREAGKAICAFVRHAAAAAAAGGSAGGSNEPATTMRRLFMADAGGDGWDQQQEMGPGAASSQGMWLTLGLLSGVCGAMPSWMLDDLIAALASLFRSFGAEIAGGWMAAAIAHPAFPRAHVSEQARQQFLGQIARCVLSPGAGLADPQQLRAFKTSIKAHCGGKKKGTTGMPPSSCAR